MGVACFILIPALNELHLIVNKYRQWGRVQLVKGECTVTGVAKCAFTQRSNENGLNTNVTFKVQLNANDPLLHLVCMDFYICKLSDTLLHSLCTIFTFLN